MRKLLIIGYFTLINILTCCQSEKSGLVPDIIVSDPPASENLSSLISSYEIVTLDSRPEAYIKNPSRTIYSDSLILIKNESNQSILIFNDSGEYLQTFSRRGRGPDEYLFFSDYTFDPVSRIISIYDNEKVKEFSLGGEFISEKKLGFRPNRLTKLDQYNTIIEKVMPSGDSISDFYIRVVDEDFKTRSARLPLKPLKGPGFGTEGQPFRTFINGDHAYFFSYFGDTVYHVDNKSIKPAFAFKYKRNIITVTNGTGKYDVDPEEALRYISFFEIGDLNFLFYNFKNVGYCFAFNSSGKKSKLYKSNFRLRDSFNNQASLLIDAMDLEKFIKLNDPGKQRCTNPAVLNAALADPFKDFQCIIRIKFLDL